jgi:hypothetical protein
MPYGANILKQDADGNDYDQREGERRVLGVVPFGKYDASVDDLGIPGSPRLVSDNKDDEDCRKKKRYETRACASSILTFHDDHRGPWSRLRVADRDLL